MDIANFKLQIAKVKIFQFSFFILLFAFLLSSCVSFQVGGEIAKGRLELTRGDPKVSLPYFQRAAALDPNYITNFTVLREGVWTYVGRANYASGNLPEARKALEQARSRYEHDYLARLYLGLVLSRQGERDRGSKEIAAGLRGLGEWFDYIEKYVQEGRFWDPTKKIQGEMQKSLAMIDGREINWPELTENVEWIGIEMEREIDRVIEEEREHRLKESETERP